ncbi:MAG: universal stress protein [Frankiaceae bacterium]|nr:universal stress protein [Frankiaceae bacterium]
MTVHERTERVVVAYDGDDVSTLALEAAAQYAALSDLLLDVVYVVDAQPLGALAIIPEYIEQARYAGQRVLAQLPEILPPGVRFTTRLKEGDPARQILDEAEGARLLVVGSTTRSVIAGWAMGSVTLHCVLHAPCPVLVVPSLQHQTHRSTSPELVEARQPA